VRLRVALAGGLCALALLVAPGSAQACSCAAIAPESKFELSDGAVIARLVSFVPREPYSADYRYRILETFKAKRRLRSGQILVIRAARDGAACGLPRAVGRRYGLFLRRSEGRWHASLCDVTSPRTMREAAANRDGSRRSAMCAG
jgi:hypothetical protein